MYGRERLGRPLRYDDMTEVLHGWDDHVDRHRHRRRGETRGRR